MITDLYKQKSRILGRMAFLLVAAAVAIVWLGAMSSIQKRPSTLSLSFGPHRAVLAVVQLTLNGRMVIDHSETGRNEGGPIDYIDGQGDALNFDVAWYDIIEDRGYTATFRLNASDLSWIGASGHAAARIIVGPGADITATTTNSEAATIIRERRGSELPGVADEPDILLAEICADSLDEDSPLLRDFRSDADRYKGDVQRRLNEESRTRWLDKNGPATPRCDQRKG